MLLTKRTLSSFLALKPQSTLVKSKFPLIIVLHLRDLEGIILIKTYFNDFITPISVTVFLQPLNLRMYPRFTFSSSRLTKFLIVGGGTSSGTINCKVYVHFKPRRKLRYKARNITRKIRRKLRWKSG